MTETPETEDSEEKQRRACIAALENLGPALERLVVSAEITEKGALRPIGGLAEKLEAALKGDRLHYIHAVGLAASQETVEHRSLNEVYPHRFNVNCRQPMVVGDSFCKLATALHRTLGAEKRFGKRLDLPSTLAKDDKHYGAAHYIPRRWLNQAISEFIEKEKSGYIVIAAEGIWGKSSFALDWWRRSQANTLDTDLPKLSGAAFIRLEEGNGDYVTPGTILEALEAETRWRCNLPRKTTAVMREETDEAYVDRFAAFLRGDLTEAVDQDTPKVVLLLDGIDEIWGPAGARPGTLFPGYLDNKLPDGVFFVLLSRPGKHLHWKRGNPSSCLNLNPADADWREKNEADLAAYIDKRADELGKGDPATKQLILRHKAGLLHAAEGHLYLLTEVLHECEGIADHPAELQAKLTNLPQGAKELLAQRVVERVLSKVEHPEATMASLALVACLREAMTVGELKRLLFDDDGMAVDGRIALTGRCGERLRWKDQLGESDLDAALRAGAECFSGGGVRNLGGLPRTTSFWHPSVRDAVRAVWRVACEGGDWQDLKAIVAAMERLATETDHKAERPLHLRIAAAASRFWPGVDGRNTLHQDISSYVLSLVFSLVRNVVRTVSRAVCKVGKWRDMKALIATMGRLVVAIDYQTERPLNLRIAAAASRLDGRRNIHDKDEPKYALSWAPWHATQAGGEAALSQVTEILTDPVFLQTAYDNLKTKAHLPIDAALAEAWKRYPRLGQRLFNVRRTMSQHDPFLAQGVIKVAAALYNDLGGLKTESDEKAWLEGVARCACARGTLRRSPGAPTPFLHFLHIGHPVKTLAISPCNRWLAVPDGNEIVLFRVDEQGVQVKEEARIGGHSYGSVGSVTFSSIDAQGQFWLASGSFDGVGLLAIGADGEHDNEMTMLDGHTSRVNHVTFSAPHQGKLWLASAGYGEVGLLAIGINGEHGNEMTMLGGLTGVVYHVAFSAPHQDKLWLASAGYRDAGPFTSVEHGEVGLLAIEPDGEHDKEMTLLDGHTDEVYHVAFSPPHQGKLWLASAEYSSVGLLAIGLDGERNKEMTLLGGHSRKVTHVAFSATHGDKLWLASGSEDCKIGLLAIGADGEHDKEMMLHGGHTNYVNHVAFSAPHQDKLWLASGSQDKNVGLLAIGSNGEHNKKMTLLGGHTGEITHIAFSAPHRDKLWLASGSEDCKVGLLAIGADGELDKEMKLYDGHTNYVNHVAFSASHQDKLWFASISDDSKVGLLAIGTDGEQDKKMTLLGGHTDRVNHVAFSAPHRDKLWLASISEDRKVGLLAIGPDGEHDIEMTMLDVYAYGCHHVVFSARHHGKLWLACRNLNGDVNLLTIGADGEHDKEMTRLGGHTMGDSHVAFSAPHQDKLWLANGSGDGIGLLAISDDGGHDKEMTLLGGHEWGVNHFAFSVPHRDKLWLASGSDDNKVGLLAIGPDGEYGREMTLLGGHTSDVNRVAFSVPYQGKLWLASGSDDSKIGLLAIGPDGMHDNKMTLLDGHMGHILHLAFSLPHAWGRLLLASAGSDEVLIWHIPDGRLLVRASFIATGETIHDLRWNDDGLLLYIAGSRGNIPVDLTLIVPENLLDDSRS